MEFPIDAAVERLRIGFLGERHRQVLIGLLVTLGRAVADDDLLLPTTVLAALIAAVTVLGTDPTTGGVL